MPEAVIVAAARTPIGRAGKGSLVDVRPDDLAAGVIQAALDQVPALDPAGLDDIYVGCAQPQDEQGGNLARRVGVLLGLDGVPAATINRHDFNVNWNMPMDGGRLLVGPKIDISLSIEAVAE